MNAEEAWAATKPARENIAEAYIIEAIEAGQRSCLIPNWVYEQTKDWLKENGYKLNGGGWTARFGSGPSITWDPSYIEQP